MPHPFSEGHGPPPAGRQAAPLPLLEEFGLPAAMVRRVAAQETTLLLSGETGTGKTRLARLIHELSPRRRQPFLVIACGALPPTLIESEMFGHLQGAFKGADRDRLGKFATERWNAHASATYAPGRARGLTAGRRPGRHPSNWRPSP
jgi:hypothetical protein